MIPGIIPCTGAMYWAQTETAWMGIFLSLPDGRQYLRYELTWKGASPEQAAHDITYFRRFIVPDLGAVIAQPALWPKEARGPSIASVFADAGVPLRRANDDRLNGWSRVRSWLAPRKYGDLWTPGLVVHPNCQRLIRTLPTLVSDDENPDDVTDTPLAYPAHGLRFFLMSQPPPWQPPPRPTPPVGTWGHALAHLIDPPTRPLVGHDLVKP